MKETQQLKLKKYPNQHVFSPSSDNERFRVDKWAERMEFCEHMLCMTLTVPSTAAALGYWQAERDEAKRQVSLLITKKLLGEPHE